MSQFQRLGPECKIESFYTIETQKNLIVCVRTDFARHWITAFENLTSFSKYCPCQGERASLTENDFQRGNKKKQMKEIRKLYMKDHGRDIVEKWRIEWWSI